MLKMGDDKPPDYGPENYLPKVYRLVDQINKALSANRINEFGSLIDQISDIEKQLLKVIVDRSTVRMLGGRRYIIQQRLIEELWKRIS